MEWKDFISSEMQKDYFINLSKFLSEDNKTNKIFPKKENIFKAFELCDLSSVKVVILGQDCYHGEGQAHGLSFSVPRGTSIPPSLRNIYKELYNDLVIEPSKSGCLEEWAKQGVLLLNSILTVREGSPGSHKDRGWEIFTDNAIKLLNDLNRPIVYILWGAFAKSKKSLITNKNHLIIEGGHPSPFSSHLFFGGKYFSRANKFLTDNKLSPIDWKIT